MMDKKEYNKLPPLIRNSFEYCEKIRYISQARGIDETIDMMDYTPSKYPEDQFHMFKALKNGEFDDIIIYASSYVGYYTPVLVSKKPRIYEAKKFFGEIHLKDYRHGGDSTQDKRLYVHHIKLALEQLTKEQSN